MTARRKSINLRSETQVDEILQKTERRKRPRESIAGLELKFTKKHKPNTKENEAPQNSNTELTHAVAAGKKKTLPRKKYDYDDLYRSSSDNDTNPNTNNNNNNDNDEDGSNVELIPFIIETPNRPKTRAVTAMAQKVANEKLLLSPIVVVTPQLKSKKRKEVKPKKDNGPVAAAINNEDNNTDNHREDEMSTSSDGKNKELYQQIPMGFPEEIRLRKLFELIIGEELERLKTEKNQNTDVLAALQDICSKYATEVEVTLMDWLLQTPQKKQVYKKKGDLKKNPKNIELEKKERMLKATIAKFTEEEKQWDKIEEQYKTIDTTHKRPIVKNAENLLSYEDRQFLAQKQTNKLGMAQQSVDQALSVQMDQINKTCSGLEEFHNTSEKYLNDLVPKFHSLSFDGYGSPSMMDNSVKLFRNLTLSLSDIQPKPPLSSSTTTTTTTIVSGEKTPNKKTPLNTHHR